MINYDWHNLLNQCKVSALDTLHNRLKDGGEYKTEAEDLKMQIINA